MAARDKEMSTSGVKYQQVSRSIVMSDDSSDDEEDVPLVQAATVAVTKVSSEATAGSSRNGTQEEGSDDLPMKTSSPGSQSDDSSDDDEDVPLAQITASAPSKGSKTVDSSDSSSDEEDMPLAQLAANNKPKEPKREVKMTAVESDSSDDEDLPLAVAIKQEAKVTPGKRKADVKKNITPKKPKSEASEKTSGKKRKADSDTPQKPKKLRPSETVEGEVRNWWKEKQKLPEGWKWRTLVHNGVLFPPDYEPHRKPFGYEGTFYVLPPEAEEVATFYAGMMETDYMKEPIFQKNFFAEFRKVYMKAKKKNNRDDLPDLKKLSLCNFSRIKQHLDRERDKKKALPKEEKQRQKDEKAELEAPYAVAIVDGHEEKVGNFRIEPPGLFRGRGKHPKMGLLKKRLQPEDITINIGEKTPVPQPPPGHRWKEVVHNHEVTWLAYWRENINGDFKYVFLGAGSAFKGQSDRKKYETARKLKLRIDKIRKSYLKDLRSKDEVKRQLATALYLIDRLALRAGNEKDEDEADTIELDFLGKDSIRYLNTVKVEEEVWKNIKKLLEGKQPSESLFHAIDTSSLNKHLKTFMDGLTAKVFRTFNASFVLDSLLAETTKRSSVNEYMEFYNSANREVAVLCNHQRSVSKNFGEQMSRIDDRIKKLEAERRELKKKLKLSKAIEKNEAEAPLDEEGKKVRIAKPDVIARQIQRKTESIKNVQIMKKMKEDNKSVALTTSKINYCDPRISIAWCLKNDVPVERVFPKTLLTKFAWALSEIRDNPEFRF